MFCVSLGFFNSLIYSFWLVCVLSWRFYCVRCGFRGDVGVYYHRCPVCGGALEVDGVLPSFSRVLGEGSTPLVFDGVGGSIVGFKLEYLNPSGSFKDRGVSYSLQFARGLGYRCVVVDSSGNTGLSTAVYASRLGLRAHIVVPATASPGKLSLMRAVGANVVVVEGRGEASRVAESYAGECFHVAHLTSPVFIEGVKSLGYEIAEYSRRATVIVPVSSGSLLVGLYRGSLEVGVKPRIIAVQASGSPSLEGLVDLLAYVGGPDSRLADALVVRNPPRLEEMARIVRESGGGVVKVGDEAIRVALRELLSMGFIVEPSSAVAWAAYRALEGKIGEAIVILTGSGLKYYRELEEISRA
jgi:threonine synthase